MRSNIRSPSRPVCSTASTTPKSKSVLGHELTHIRNGDVRMMVIAVIIAGVISFFAELVFRLWFTMVSAFGRHASERRGGGGGADGHPDRRRAARAGLRPVFHHSACAVAVARIPRRRRLGGTDQESRRHDFGVAQDRRPRRVAGRDIRSHGNVHRQSARGFRRIVRYPSDGRKPGRGTGQIRRRSQSRSARAAAKRKAKGRRIGITDPPPRTARGERRQRRRARCNAAIGAAPSPQDNRAGSAEARPDRGARIRRAISRHGRVAINHIDLKMHRADSYV